MYYKINPTINKCVIFLISILGIFIYFICPNQYDNRYCVLATLLYIVVFALYIIEIKMQNFFCFGFIFSIVWFFVYYLYPTVVYPISKYYYFMFFYDFDENVITKATFLSLIGYCAFVLGMLSYRDKHKERYSVNIYEIHIGSNLLPTVAVAISFIIDLIRYVFLNMSQYFGEGNMSPNESNVWGYISNIQSVVMFVALTIEFHILIQKHNHQIFFLRNPLLWMFTLGDLAILFYSGNRNVVLSTCLLILAGVALYSKKISFIKTLGLMATGLILMYLVLLWRTSKNFNGHFSFLDICSDLVINNYTLYSGYEYVQSNGYIPFTLIGSLLNCIPFLQGFVTWAFGIPIFKTSSARFFSYLAMGENASFGVGTNIIAALYLSCGFIGVIFCMFLLGRFTQKHSCYKSNKSIYALLMYFMVIMHAVYWVRADFFYPINRISYSFLLMWLYITFFGKKVELKENINEHIINCRQE